MKKPSFLPRALRITSPLTLLLSLNLYAQTPVALEAFNQFFKSGQYTKAIEALKDIPESESVAGQKNYLLALSYSKLQEYDKAITHFERALKENNASVDLQYEYGQALYAANELKAARRAFSESVKKKYNLPASLYYVAHISQILEEYTVAKDNYTELIKNKEVDAKTKQIARFQLGETLLMIMREKVKNPDDLEKGVAKYILPMMKQAYNSDKSSQVAFEINSRMLEIQKEFGLDPDLLANGKRISPKRFSAYFSQRVKFDENISQTNEENNVQQSKKESYIFESELYAKYDFVLKKRFIITPEARINFIQHSDQDSSEVYQNDAYSIYTNLKNKYEHTVNSQPASLLFDMEYSNTYKDWNQTHTREAYAQSFNFVLGESFSYFAFGDTSLRLKRKGYKGENEAISNTTYTITADQTIFLARQHMLIVLFEANMVDNFNNTTTSTNSYLSRFDYLIPEIMPRYTLGFALSTTITDTKEQKETRGMEMTINPSVDISKQINDKMKISMNYDYTKNKSKLIDYSYQKNVFSTEFRYSF